MRERHVLSDIRRIMSDIRRTGGAVISNYYMNTPEDAVYDAVVSPRALVFSYADGDIRRVYFYAADRDELARALSISGGRGVIDYVAKRPPDFESALTAGGCQRYATMRKYVNGDLPAILGRKTVAAVSGASFSDTLGFAKPEEARELHALLHTVLDVNTGHFCNLGELERMIADGTVLRERAGGEITAFLWYRIEGQKLYWYQMYAKAPGVGLHVLCYGAVRACVKKGIRRAYCWINETNRRSIGFHSQYGFSPDAVADYVYIN